MTIWTDGCGIFETEEEARDNVLENMEWNDFEEYFHNNISFHDFFTRVRNIVDPERFFIEFKDEFCDAENHYFEENYWAEEQNEDEEQRECAILFYCFYVK